MNLREGYSRLDVSPRRGRPHPVVLRHPVAVDGRFGNHPLLEKLRRARLDGDKVALLGQKRRRLLLGFRAIVLDFRLEF